MNDLSTVINRGEGGLKENPPCTPLKENKGTSIFTVPVPVPIARTHAPAQGTPTAERTGTGTGTGTEAAANRTGTGTGTEAAANRTGTGTEAAANRTGTGTVNFGNSGTGTGTTLRRIAVNAEFILHGYNAQGLRYDPVETAMAIFHIPKISNGRNNARILRWHVRRLGEETFRQIVYDQWRENNIDGGPDLVIAALTRKLFKAGGDVR